MVCATFAPAPASSRVPELCRLAHVLCAEDAACLTLARDVTGNSKLARDCDRSELRPHLPKLRLLEQGTEGPEHPTTKKVRQYPAAYHILRGYLKDARFLGRRPELLVPLPSRVGRNLAATRRCGTTTPANPSDGRSGYCAAPASGKLSRNQHRKTTEERRERESTPQKEMPVAPPAGAGTRRPRPGKTVKGRLG